MDLLSQYKQDHPEAFQEQKRQPLTDQYGREYTGMIAFVMRLSGGRIRDARQASYVLLGAAIFVFLVALVMFFAGLDVLPAPRFGEEEARKQLEEYKNIQPF